MEAEECVQEVKLFLLQIVFSKGKGGCPGNCVNSKPR